ncbi:MAG: DUF4132 domain-containing protein [Microcoleaceae cyanobacterium]
MTSAEIHSVTREFHCINLNPEDWFWATWRPLIPLKRPDPQIFDKDKGLENLGKVLNKGQYWQLDWSLAEIPISMSKEAAGFWFAAMLESSNPELYAGEFSTKLMTKLQKWSFEDELTLPQIQSILHANFANTNYCKSFPKEIILPLANLLSPPELIELMLAQPPNYLNGQTTRLTEIFPINCFRRDVVPYLNLSEQQQLQERLRPELNPIQWLTGQSYTRPPEAFFLAATLGMHQELLPLIASWPDDAYIGKENYSVYYQKPQEIIFGLGDPSLVETHIRRLKLFLTNSAYIRAWLAHTEYRALDWICESILTIQNKDLAKELLETFALVKAPEAALFMLELQLASKAPQVARQWLEENLVHSIQGLIPVAKGRGKLADSALEWLRTIQRRGHGELIQSCLNQLSNQHSHQYSNQHSGDEDLTAKIFAAVDDILFDEHTTPAWLEQMITAAQKSKKTKVLTWIAPTDLPSIRIGEFGLNPEQTAILLTTLKQSQLDQSPALITALKHHANSKSLDQFAWSLFERWLAEGAPAKEKWAMMALGLLGSDETTFKLTPLIKVWPGESQHPRAVLGLQCLRAIGTDTALMQINGIAQKLKFKGLKAKAQNCMEDIARDRGLTRAQLEDRIIPDCDLDERGTRVFDFGPRQFQFVLGENMKPMVRDEAGKLKPDLPKPGVRDDAELANQAVADWKLIKKQISELVKIQAIRLEQAMVQGRRWSVEEFELLLVHHPLMINLVRLLLWGGYNEAGELIQTFRVTEDQTYANSTDEEIKLEGVLEGELEDRLNSKLVPVTQVGILHPLYLETETKNTWGELLSDYEIVPPFPQLGRAIYTLESGEAEYKELKRFSQFKIPAPSLVGTLEKLGWTRGTPQDGGVFDLHYKQFEQANITAVIGYREGIPVGYMDGWDDQTLESCYFLGNLEQPWGYWFDDRDHKMLTLGAVDPIVISEVLSDLNTLAAKGR